MEQSICAGDQCHFQIDDDATGFLDRTPGAPSRKVNPKVALRILYELSSNDSGEAGVIGTAQNSFPPGPAPLKTPGLPVQCVLILNLVSARHRGPDTLEDLDFALQATASGRPTVMTDHLRVVTPGGHAAPGGLEEAYRSGRAESAARELLKMWPEMRSTTRPHRVVLLKGEMFKRLAAADGTDQAGRFHRSAIAVWPSLISTVGSSPSSR